MKKRSVREKRHRLGKEIYTGERIISFTICIKDRKSFFTNDIIFNVFERKLLEELLTYDCSSYVYLFMPDHVHITLTGNNSKSNIKKCIDIYKQKTGYWLAKNNFKEKWQKDYYDHILKSKENLDVHIKYILNNPVRVNLVENWKQYPFKGSTIYNLIEWAENW